MIEHHEAIGQMIDTGKLIMTNQQETWGAEYKMIKQVIQELQSFANQELIVLVSDDGSKTRKPVKLLGKEFVNHQAYCTLFIEK